MALAFKRGKRKVIADYKIDDIYRYYKKNTKVPLDQKKFIAILKSFHSKIADKMIGENFEYYLPARLGSMYIRAKELKLYINPETNDVETRVLRMDYAASKKKWEQLYPGKTAEEIADIPDKPKIFNLHKSTDGKYAQWHWDVTTCNAANKTAYAFEQVRELKERMSEYINTFNKVDYYV